MTDYLLGEKIIGDIQRYLEELRASPDITWEKYGEDIRSKRFIERTIHILIEACFDLANHIVSDQGFREPKNYRDIFNVLSEEKIIDPSSLAVYEKMASFRNILVHHYEKVDDTIVFGIFRNHLNVFDRFVAELTAYIESKGS